jgi:hypothetical protein
VNTLITFAICVFHTFTCASDSADDKTWLSATVIRLVIRIVGRYVHAGELVFKSNSLIVIITTKKSGCNHQRISERNAHHYFRYSP